MNIMDCLCEIVLIVLFGWTAYQCITKKNIGNARWPEIYTQESIESFSKLYLVGVIIAIIYEIFEVLVKLNIVKIGLDLVNGKGIVVYLVRIAGVIPVAIFTIIGYACILKKKDSYVAAKKSEKNDEDF